MSPFFTYITFAVPLLVLWLQCSLTPNVLQGWRLNVSKVHIDSASTTIQRAQCMSRGSSCQKICEERYHDCAPPHWTSRSCHNIRVKFSSPKPRHYYFGIGSFGSRPHPTWEAHLLVYAKDPRTFLRSNFNWEKHPLRANATNGVFFRSHSGRDTMVDRYIKLLPDPPSWWNHAIRYDLDCIHDNAWWTAMLMVYSADPAGLFKFNLGELKYDNVINAVAWDELGLPLFYYDVNDLSNRFNVMRDLSLTR